MQPAQQWCQDIAYFTRFRQPSVVRVAFFALFIPVFLLKYARSKKSAFGLLLLKV